MSLRDQTVRLWYLRLFHIQCLLKSWTNKNKQMMLFRFRLKFFYYNKFYMFISGLSHNQIKIDLQHQRFRSEFNVLYYMFWNDAR